MSHIILVAFEVEADDREQAQEALLPALQPVLKSHIGSWSQRGPAECWWVAEDDRIDGSDNDSAVFVYPDSQAEAGRLLNQHGLTAGYNVRSTS